MSIPLLIVGGDREQRLASIEVRPGPDFLLIAPEKSIGIKEIRSLQHFLMRRPYQKDIKTAVIDQAETMTLPAQQAILKTLEEPPAHSQIILLCDHEHQLLETIVSRCRVKKLAAAGLTESELKAQDKIFNSLKQAKTPERFAILSAYSGSNSSAKDFVIGQLHFLHSELKHRPNPAQVKLINALNLALAALRVNVNPKLTLEVLSLSY